MLGTRGRTPSVKGTSGINARWRRTPVQGSHYYMWWIPQSETGLYQPTPGASTAGPSILIHSIRHHDKTNTPINLGTLSDYEEVVVSELDPRFAEQREIGRQLSAQELALSTVKGLPGSGKTVSLLYLVRDILRRTPTGQILYVTYTPRLKRAAQEFLYAQDAAVQERVRFCTLTELEGEFTGSSLYAQPFSALQKFEQAIKATSLSSLGPWRKYVQTLYTEIRAYLLGRDFPDGYTLPPGAEEIDLPHHSLDAQVYAQLRGVDYDAAQTAVRVTKRAVHGHLFREQKAARAALVKLMMGQQPGWMDNLGALLIDEVQDFTLLQIAFLGELARTRAEQMAHSLHSHAPFIFTVAGDESQIVQPSGFDWGVTKNLLYAQLGVRPQEFEFRHQRRSPHKLTSVIDNSWGFYGNLPKSERPSAQRQSFADEAMEDAQRYEEGGHILLCPPVSAQSGQQRTARSAHRRSALRTQPDWTALIQELNEKPGRVLVDMSESLRTQLEPAVQDQSDEVVFLPRDIKGLERATVIIHGLNDAYEYALRLCDEAHDGGNVIPRFEARRLFDEMRVALSRSTQTLILLEAPDAPVLRELGIATRPESWHSASSVPTNGARGANHKPGEETEIEYSDGVLDWDDLLHTLRTEEMSELEVVEGYLEEVDDLLERERWEQAHRRNRRAYDLAQQMGDQALQREAEQQFVEAHLQEAENLAHLGEWERAYQRNREADELVQIFPDPLLQERVDEQAQNFHRAIVEQVQQLLQQAEQWMRSHSYTLAHEDLQRALTLAHVLDDEELHATADDALADLCWQWAYSLTGDGSAQTNTARAAQLLEEAAEALDRGGGLEAPQALRILAARYRQVPHVGNLSKKQIPQVLEYAQQYLDLMAPLNAEQDAYLFIERWLEETYAALGDMVSFYYPWAVAAHSLDAAILYAHFDEYLWDLEHRAESLSGKTRKERDALNRFRAFVLGYNEEHAQAAAAWEALEEWSLAAEQARYAGEIEHAYELMRRIKGHAIPEELATAVQAMRRLQQLEHKHEALLPAEKQSIVDELARLQELLAPPIEDPSSSQ